MKSMHLVSLCAIILISGTTSYATIYTEANVYRGGILHNDSGEKPYSQASSWYYNDVHYLGIAEVQDNSLKGLSKAEDVGIDNYGFWGITYTTSRMTIPLQVLSDGPISFDWALTGELRVVLVGPGYWGFNPQYDSSYAVSIIDNVSNDSASSSDILTVTEQEGIGSYITPVDLHEIYDFGGGSFSAESIIDITLELQTGIDAGYGYFGTGSVISSNFSDSLSIDNLVNLEVVPEPTSFILLLLGGIGLRQLRRR